MIFNLQVDSTAYRRHVTIRWEIKKTMILKHLLIQWSLILLLILFCGHRMAFCNDYPEEGTLTSISEIEIKHPGYLKFYFDPRFNSKVTRITDSKTFGYKNPRHSYSKSQPWNCDSSFIRIRNHLIDGNTYKLLRVIPYLDEAKWSHTNPFVIYGFYGKKRFARLSLVDDKISILREFEEYDEVRIGPWEGNLSADDKYVVFSARTDQDLIVIVYNIMKNQVISSRHFSGYWKKLDWVSISPSGKYVLFNWYPGKTASSKVIDCYSQELKFIRRLADQGCHGDIGYDTKGAEVYVQFEFGEQRGIWSYRLVDGKRSRLLPDKYNGGHLSCRNIMRSGWAYLSCNRKGFREVFALKLDGSGTVNRFAQHHSSAKPYISEVQAVPSPDGTKVMFASNWNGQHEVNSYVIETIHKISNQPGTQQNTGVDR